MPAGNWTCGAACGARSNRPARCRRRAGSAARRHAVGARGNRQPLHPAARRPEPAGGAAPDAGQRQSQSALTRLRQREGVATELDVSQADAQAAAIEAAVPPLAVRVDQLMNALALLLDQPPHAARAAGNAGAHPGRSGAGAGGPAQRAGRAASRHPPGSGPPACRGGRDRRGRGRFLSAHHPVGQHRPAGAATGQAGHRPRRHLRRGPGAADSLFEGGRLRGRLRLREAQAQRQRWHSRKPCSAPGTMSTTP